jgi:hypothetical protein
MWSSESEHMFWRKMSSPFSEIKNEPSKKPVRTKVWYLLHAGFLLDIFFDLEDGGDMFL